MNIALARDPAERGRKRILVNEEEWGTAEMGSMGPRGNY